MKMHEETQRDELRASYEIFYRMPMEKELTEKLARAERAIAFRRLARKARKNKPITFASPSLWSLSGRANER